MMALIWCMLAQDRNVSSVVMWDTNVLHVCIRGRRRRAFHPFGRSADSGAANAAVAAGAARSAVAASSATVSAVVATSAAHGAAATEDAARVVAAMPAAAPGATPNAAVVFLPKVGSVPVNGDGARCCECTSGLHDSEEYIQPEKQAWVKLSARRLSFCLSLRRKQLLQALLA